MLFVSSFVSTDHKESEIFKILFKFITIHTETLQNSTSSYCSNSFDFNKSHSAPSQCTNMNITIIHLPEV